MAFPAGLECPHHQRSRDCRIQRIAFPAQRLHGFPQRAKLHPGLRAHVSQVIVPQLLFFRRASIVCGHLQQTHNGVRRILKIFGPLALGPHLKGLLGVIGRIHPSHQTELIKVRRPTTVCQSEPQNLVPGFQSNLCSVHLELRPVPSRRQRSGQHPLLSVGSSVGDGLQLAPDRPVFPSVRVYLNHHRRGRLHRIQKNHQTDPATGRHFKRRRSGPVIVLDDALAGNFQRPTAQTYGPVLFGHPHWAPSLRSGLHLGASGEIVVNDHHRLLLGKLGRCDPGRILVIDLPHPRLQCVCSLLDFEVHGRNPRLLLRRGQFHHGRRKGRVPIKCGIRARIVERVQLVKLPLGKRVKLVVMTRRASRRHPQPRLGQRGGPVHRIPELKLLRNRTPFVGGHVAPVESRGHQLLQSGRGKQVSGNLFHRKLVKRQVPVEGADHPVAVGPDGTLVVQMQSMRVPVPCQVEPVPRHLFPVPGRPQEPVHHTALGSRRGIPHKTFHLGKGRRQPGERERDPADPSLPGSTW